MTPDERMARAHEIFDWLEGRSEWHAEREERDKVNAKVRAANFKHIRAGEAS